MIEPVNEVPFLLAQNGPLQGQIWPINKEIIIGRDPLCDIVYQRPPGFPKTCSNPKTK